VDEEVVNAVMNTGEQEVNERHRLVTCEDI
jgi:hypothetical protein